MHYDVEALSMPTGSAIGGEFARESRADAPGGGGGIMTNEIAENLTQHGQTLKLTILHQSLINSWSEWLVGT